MENFEVIGTNRTKSISRACVSISDFVRPGLILGTLFGH